MPGAAWACSFLWVFVQGAEEGLMTSLSDLGLRFCGSLWAGQVVRGAWTLCKLCVTPPPPPDFVLWDFLLSEYLFLSETGLTAVAFPFHLFL